MADNEIHLYGTVGASWWDEDWFSAKSVREALSKISGDVIVRINSGGGIATEGQAIYTMLVDHPGKVTVIVDGVAASAASLIAMAGDEIVMRLGAWMLIHDPATPWTEGRGTEDDHRKEAEILGVISNAYADVYAARAGIGREDARSVMRVETVLDGQQAVDMGFATSYDGETQAAAAARFDYRIYANAPQELRKASRDLGRAPGREAVMAMIAGRPRMVKKEAVMADNENQVSADTGAEEEARETGAENAAAPDAVASERKRAARIMNMVTVAGLSMDFARTHIDKGTSSDDVVDLIVAEKAKAGGEQKTAAGATTRIVRDERDTRREGMSEAIFAQMRRADPKTDKARPYMAQSLVEMAAATIDHQGPIRTAQDRIDVFMAASHSRSDFAGIFENALNKALLDRYAIAEPTYRAIAREKTFNDFRVHPMVRSGDFPKLLPIAENGEIKYGTFGEKRETAILASYGIALRISRQMMIDDDLGAIDDMVSDYGAAVADFEEETFYTFMAAATLASDGGAIWQTGATRGNLAAAGTAITVAAIGAGTAAMRKQVTIDGKKMNLRPSILLVSPDKELEALQLLTTIAANDTVKVNPYSGRLTPVVSAQLTGNAWHLFADPRQPGGQCFVYGFLNGSTGPRVRTEEPFGQQGWAMSVEHDFGTGAADFRGTYKNPGA